MRRWVGLLLATAFASAPVTAKAGTLDLRLGGFAPQTKSDLFDNEHILFTVEKRDWRGLTGGVQYAWRLAPHLELAAHLDGYGRTVHTNYRDFTGDGGREVRQSLKLSAVPLGLSLRLTPESRHTALFPYLAAGVDAIFWEYEEFGDFIDFEDPTLPIINDSFVSRGVAPGVHAAAGLRVRLTDDVGLVGEVRYQAAKANMGRDFRGFKLDLTGPSATLGVALNF
ncbi:MAG TPA: hypothetical protein VGL15_05005 [Vicinamibacteria bacterium]|jgi:hypothetical protein